MSELRNRTLAPPPPRHPAVRPPSPNPHTRSSNFNAPPLPVPAHPSLPPRPPPRQDARFDYSAELPPSQVVPPLDTPYTPAIQRLPPPVSPMLPGDPRSFSENGIGSTSSADVGPVGTPTPPPRYPSNPLELLPPVSRASSFHSITDSQVMVPPPPPVHHAGQARSLTVDSTYEATLSEKELRDLYDDEEIDRFLRLFSAVGCSSLSCRFIDPSTP